MADAFWNQDGADYQDRTVSVDLVFTAGTSGAVPTTFTYADGIASVSLTSTTYTVTFQQAFKDFLGLRSSNIQATFAAAGAAYAVPLTYAVTGGVSVVTLCFCKGSDGTAVALATGDIPQLLFRFKA